MTPDWLAKPPWLPVRAPRQSAPPRRVDDYVETCRQFDVTSTPRYQPRGKTTWCNVFVWDVTTALGCEIPHWYSVTTLRATRPGQGSEMLANDMVVWLRAEVDGWRKIQRAVALETAAKGEPTVVAWENYAGPGHVAMLLPGELIAQAGAANLWLAPIKTGFGEGRSLEFFSHP